MAAIAPKQRHLLMFADRKPDNPLSKIKRAETFVLLKRITDKPMSLRGRRTVMRTRFKVLCVLSRQEGTGSDTIPTLIRDVTCDGLIFSSGRENSIYFFLRLRLADRPDQISVQHAT